MKKGPESGLTLQGQEGKKEELSKLHTQPGVWGVLKRGWQLQPAPSPPWPVPAEEGSLVGTELISGA